jgi:Fe-S-cluster-containing dehydrogenase component
MKVIINPKICDNSPACGGIQACPTGALFWDEGDHKIGYDRLKCIGCGACVNACPVMAIIIAKTKSEEKEIADKIAADPRTEVDLFVDRYGSDIVSTQPTQIDMAIKTAKQTKGVAVLELFNPATAHCLVTSIPVSEIFAEYNYTHLKSEPNEQTLADFGITELPSLLIFRDGEQIGKIEGYFENNSSEKSLLIAKIKKFLDKEPDN